MDTVSNALSKIQNACMTKSNTVELKSNKVVKEIVRILKEENFIDDYSIKDRVIAVELGYVNKESKITHIEKVTNPGRRIYISGKDLKPVLNGRGIAIVSTSKGIMSGDDAKMKNIGGEYICKIW